MQLISLSLLLLIVCKQNDAGRIKREHFQRDNENNQHFKTEIFNNASDSSKLHETSGVSNKTIGLEERPFQENHDEVKDIVLKKESVVRKPLHLHRHHKIEEKHCPLKQKKHADEYLVNSKSFSRAMHPSLKKYQFLVKYEPKIPIYPSLLHGEFYNPIDNIAQSPSLMAEQLEDFQGVPRILSIGNPVEVVNDHSPFSFVTNMLDDMLTKTVGEENTEINGECEIHNKNANNNNDNGVMQVCSCRFYKNQ